MPIPFTSTLLSALTSLPLIPLAFVSLSLYTAHGALHRLYLSPIAKFPGPRFAALTFWNEFFYDVVCAGRYTWKIAEYHGRYGELTEYLHSLGSFREVVVVMVGGVKGEGCG